MMKKHLLFLFGLIISTFVLADVPQGISHQAVMRDADNNLIIESPIGLQISILQGTHDGYAVYVETHQVVSNQNGLISYIIGSGNVVDGVFEGIDWGAGPYWLETKADPVGGTNYTISGVTMFLSVPYALHAQKAQSAAVAESFITKPPKAIATDATEIGEFSATLNGIVNGEGFSTVVVFEWGTSTDYGNTVTAIQSPVTGADDVTVYAHLSELQAATTYYYRIKASSAVDVAYSENMMFTTNQSMAQLNTLPVSDITPFSAVSGGNITYDGGLPVIQRGIVWSTEPEPDLENNDGITDDGPGSGTYVSELTGLLPGTQYHIKAYVINIAGVAYGNLVTFTTSFSDDPAFFSSAETYCQGDPGVTFGVANSELDETYRLQRFNAQTNQWQNISTAIGNGGTVLFGGQHLAGNYRLQQDPENEIEITEKSLPQIFEVTGGGGYCDNTTDYPVIGLSNSQPFSANVIYELYLDGNFVIEQPGIGNAFNFANPDPDIIGFPDPGIYTVLAILDGCEAEMDGEVEVIVFPAPSISYTFGEVQGPYDCGHVEFVASVDGVGDPFSYKWFFSETDSLLTQNNEVNFIFPAFGIGTETFEVTLEVTDDNGCVVSQVENVTVNQRPDASLNEISNPNQNPPGSTTLAYCDATLANPEGFFDLINASSTQGTNTWYEIIWGDGAADFEDDLFNEIVNHEYAEIGSYYLTFTVEGPTTCIGQTEYFVYVGAEPDGTLGQTGSLSGWVPFDFEFIIGNTAGNPLGTQYYLDFGDGNDTIFYDVPPNGLLNYTYTTCPTQPSNLGVWGYIATLTINNACGYAGSTIHHVRVNCSAQAGFTLYEGNLLGGNGIDTLITEQTVSFINESTPGFFVTGGGTNYIDEVFYFWDFGDGHTSNEENPVHTYEETNQWYEVSLTSWTSINPSAPPADPKGYDSITKHIFVQDSNGAATVTDIDGNVYQTVIIGNQEWMAENLRVSRYNNEDAIPTGLSNEEWASTASGAYAIYDNDNNMLEAYGKLYNWYAVADARGLCPEGWSVPSDDDWTVLVNYFVSQGFPNEWYNPNGAGNALKSCRKVGHPDGGDCDTSEHPRWDSDGTHSGFDEFGFSALPGGYRNAVGSCHDIGYYGFWWSSSEDSSARAWSRFMSSGNGGVSRSSLNKRLGPGVRCVKKTD